MDHIEQLSHDYGDSTDATFKSLDDVLAERGRQDTKWGEQNHDPFIYLAILTEEVGELAQAALHARFGGPAAVGLRDEAVQVAAVALAIVQCLDRGKWFWQENRSADAGDEPAAEEV